MVKDPPPERTVADVYERSERLYRHVRALHAPHIKGAQDYTYGELMDEARAFGAGIAQLGLQPGDRVALFSDNRPRWLVADLGLLMTGLVEVPRGSDTSDTEFDFILKHSGARAVIVQDARLLKRLTDVGATKDLVAAIVMADDVEDGDTVHKFESVLAAGRSNPDGFHERRQQIKPSDLAAIVYTSGTTGSPKGVMLSHRNLASQMDSVDIGVADYLPTGSIVLSILPTWHAYERVAEYFLMAMGATVCYTDKRHLRLDLEKLQPHVFPCVPRIWETVYEAIQDKLSKAPPMRQRLFSFFYGVGLKQVKAQRIASGQMIRRTGNEVTIASVATAHVVSRVLRPIVALGDRLVFRHLRRAVSGGRLLAAVSGGGSLAPYLDDFFEVVGVPILNGYGLTETAPVLTVRRVDWNVRGSVGLPLRATEIQIRTETGDVLPKGTPGIIFARGPQVMAGYYNNPEATAKVLDGDGWFNTGDIGFIALDGDLVITGRAKDTIVLASGENVEPEPIENVARRSALVAQVMVIGQDQKSLGALVVPNGPALATQLGVAPETPVEELIRNPAAAKAVQREISDAMKADGSFKSNEAIAKVVLISEPFSEANGLLTGTLKMKRNKVAELYAAEIASAFTD